MKNLSLTKMVSNEKGKLEKGITFLVFIFWNVRLVQIDSALNSKINLFFSVMGVRHQEKQPK